MAEAVIATLRPIQEEYARLLADKGYLDGVLAEGAARADAIARRTLAKVYKKLAFCSCKRPGGSSCIRARRAKAGKVSVL